MATKTDTFELDAVDLAGQPEIIRLGKDEMNMAEFPISHLADRVPHGQTTIEFQDCIFDEKISKTVVRKVTIKAPAEPNGQSGLPTAVDDDVILGLIQLTKTVNGFTSREVEFTRLELIRLLGWPDSGESYRRLTVSLKRWLSVTLLYENAWRDNRKGAWTTVGFHILDNIELNDARSTGEQGELFPSKIVWNKVVFESFKAGYLKSLDYGLYLKLHHQTSKRMYRFLSKRMYHGSKVELDLRDFAIAHIGLSASYSKNAGKIKEKLQEGLKELEEIGFLEPADREQRYRKEGKHWQICLKGRAKSPAPPSTTEEVAPPVLADALTQRGVTKAAALELVKQHSAEAIEQKIEVFDWLLEKQDKQLAKSPAGYLVKSIKDDYAIPKGFVSEAERQRLAEAKRAGQRKDNEERERKRVAKAREDAARDAIDAYWRSLTPAEQKDLQAAVDAKVDPQELAKQKGGFKLMGQQIRRETHIRQLLVAAGQLAAAE